MIIGLCDQEDAILNRHLGTSHILKPSKDGQRNRVQRYRELNISSLCIWSNKCHSHRLMKVNIKIYIMNVFSTWVTIDHDQ